MRTVPDDAPDFYSSICNGEPEPTTPAASEPSLGTPANPFLEYPRFYFCRGGVSDRKFVMSRMAVIPKEHKHAVSSEYERLFANGRTREQRRAANEYMHRVASEYRRN